MNKKTLCIAILSLFLSTNITNAANIDNILENSPISKNAIISISIKDTKNGKVIYEQNSHKLLNPASILKTFTMRSSYHELGKDFVFTTDAYLDKDKNLYIKLSGDPEFSTGKLKALLNEVKSTQGTNQINDIILDTTSFDKKEWGIGWMWDDDTSELLPKYSIFSINENKITLQINPGKNGQNPNIEIKNQYNIPIINKLTNGSQTEIQTERLPWKTSDTTEFSGTVNKPIEIQLPINNPEKNFVCELKKSIKQVGINYTGSIKIAPVNKQAEKIASVSSQPLRLLIANTLKNSNNFYSEMIFKKAGEHYSKKIGTTENGIELFNKYYSDIKSDNIIIVDACGISRNNIITADWATSALNKIAQEKDFNEYLILMAKPMEGTLSNRLLNISLKTRAKTGTASNISSIVGYVDTKSNKKYSFAIMIQNHNSDVKKVKELEDKIINEIYKM